MSDLNDLLDATLDDLEDLPSFQPFPVGAHKVLASFDTKEINGKQAVSLDFKLVEVLELADASITEEIENAAGDLIPNPKFPKAGDSAGTMFMLDNEYGRGNLKKCATPFGEALELSTIREIIEGVKEVECIVLTGLRKDKNDPDKFYLDVKEIQVV